MSINECNGCNKCGKIFKYKYLLDRHNSGKIQCNTPKNLHKKYDNIIKSIENKLINLENQTNTSINKCYFCLHIFYNKSSKTRHLKTCQEKKKLIDE